MNSVSHMGLAVSSFGMNSVSHIGLTVSSLETVSSWYRDALGFEIMQMFAKPAWECEVALLRLGSFHLELFCFANSALNRPNQLATVGVPVKMHPTGSAFLALAVPRLDETLAHLRAMGTTVVADKTRGVSGHVYAFVQDPDGTLVELYEPLSDTEEER